MVFNPLMKIQNATQTYAQQFNYTQNATLEFSPTEYFPAELPFSRTTTATGATATPTTAPSASSTASASSSTSHSSLGTGPIVGIAIGGFAVLVLAAALIYMCGRQKTVNEILRHSNVPPSAPASYQPNSPGITEVKYPNLLSTPRSDKDQFSNNYNLEGENDSYRSLSPPLGNGSPGMGVVSPGSAQFSDTQYYNTQTPHEMGNQNIASRAGLRFVISSLWMKLVAMPLGSLFYIILVAKLTNKYHIRPYNPAPEHEGPHELPSNLSESPNTIPSTT